VSYSDIVHQISPCRRDNVRFSKRKFSYSGAFIPTQPGGPPRLNDSVGIRTCNEVRAVNAASLNPPRRLVYEGEIRPAPQFAVNDAVVPALNPWTVAAVSGLHGMEKKNVAPAPSLAVAQRRP